MISITRDQVETYVEKIGGDVANQSIAMGQMVSSTVVNSVIDYKRKRDNTPLVTFEGTDSHLSTTDDAGTARTSSAAPTFGELSATKAKLVVTVATGTLTAGNATRTLLANTASYILIDGRHY
jgi:hypothetical protein